MTPERPVPSQEATRSPPDNNPISMVEIADEAPGTRQAQRKGLIERARRLLGIFLTKGQEYRGRADGVKDEIRGLRALRERAAFLKARCQEILQEQARRMHAMAMQLNAALEASSNNKLIAHELHTKKSHLLGELSSLKLFRKRADTLCARISSLPFRSSQVANAEATVQHQHNVPALSHIQARIKKVDSEVADARLQARIATSAKNGVATHGFVGYLERSQGPERSLLQSLLQMAQSEGRKKAGRPPASSQDPQATIKAERAAKMRNERDRDKAESNKATKPLRSNDGQVGKADVKSERPSTKGIEIGDITPITRQHEERMRSLPLEERKRYADRLQQSRAWGKEALQAEIEAYQKLGKPAVYNCPHAGIQLGPQVQLVAIRGDQCHEDLADIAAGKMPLERWLAEPAIARNKLKGKGSRLTKAAGQILIALPVGIQAKMKLLQQHRILEFMVDLAIARLSLEGHRVAAYLHLDSHSGHPHLHVVFSRVRMTDKALWNLDGRSRTPALWLHGRAQTALGFGMKTYPQDIDALGGMGEAALDGEVLMIHGNLKATRTSLDGELESIPLQGDAAAKRIHGVGRPPCPVPGGIALFGLGRDPKAESVWKTAVSDARKNLDHQRLRALMAHRPPKRGWWLDLGPRGIAQNARPFAEYLGRGHRLG